MENQQPIQEQGNEVEGLFIELTPEQESEMLVTEFDDFAKSLELATPHIPAEHTSVTDKVNGLCAALRSITKEEMLILFNAMEAAHPTPTFDDEGEEEEQQSDC